MGSQPNVQKIFFRVWLCRAFFDDHFGKKILRISLRNDDVIVKILIVKNRRCRRCFFS
jgi:hypothetical protein